LTLRELSRAANLAQGVMVPQVLSVHTSHSSLAFPDRMQLASVGEEIHYHGEPCRHVTWLRFQQLR
jgi:hypothetical protein